jgi:hypothetical protein
MGAKKKTLSSNHPAGHHHGDRQVMETSLPDVPIPAAIIAAELTSPSGAVAERAFDGECRSNADGDKGGERDDDGCLFHGLWFLVVWIGNLRSRFAGELPGLAFMPLRPQRRACI